MTNRDIIKTIDREHSPFDMAVNSQEEQKVVLIGKIEIGEHIFKPNNQSFESIAIFRAIEIALSSSWWNELSPRSHGNYLFVLKAFLPWLHDFEFSPSSRFKVLKLYEAKRAKSMKIDSTGIRQIVNLLRRSTERGILDPTELRFIVSLARASAPLPRQERTSYTLARHFSSIPWLKKHLGEKWFLIESPKRTMQSFLICISISLEALVKARSDTKNFNFENYNTRTKKPYQGNNYWILYSKNLLKNTLQSGDHELLLLQLADFVSNKKHKQIQQIFESRTLFDDINSETRNELFNRKCFLKPNLFSPYSNPGPSVIEQQLFAWLCAAQTVAPSSISQLTKSNFAIEYGPRGNLAYMQCSYNKSRSTDDFKKTKLLGVDDIESAAMCNYIASYGKNNDVLCPDILRIVAYNFDSFGNLLSRLLRIWQIPSIRQRIFKAHKKHSTEPIFLEVIEALSNNMGQSFPKWSHEQKVLGRQVSYNEYLKATQRFTPIALFGLSHIKTTAVHAQSDRYRSSDLLNYNSHNAETEKHSYLTDSNKDWVNQYGRISRIVMREVERTHTNIDFNAVINTARKKTTARVVEENSSESASRRVVASTSDNTLIVIDSVETVINFLHYIDQAKSNFRQLLKRNKEFVENILLPNVEWMSYMLIQKLSPKLVRKGRQEFNEIKAKLPQLFRAQLVFTL